MKRESERERGTKKEKRKIDRDRKKGNKERKSEIERQKKQKRQRKRERKRESKRARESESKKNKKQESKRERQTRQTEAHSRAIYMQYLVAKARIRSTMPKSILTDRPGFPPVRGSAPSGFGDVLSRQGH